MNIVFCHGVMGPDEKWRAYDTTFGWKNWLQFMVELRHDIIMQTPKFPHAHALLMKYDEWEKIMDHQEINESTVLIGHSAGGGFVLKYLSMHQELNSLFLKLITIRVGLQLLHASFCYKSSI